MGVECRDDKYCFIQKMQWDIVSYSFQIETNTVYLGGFFSTIRMLICSWSVFDWNFAHWTWAAISKLTICLPCYILLKLSWFVQNWRWFPNVYLVWLVIKTVGNYDNRRDHYITEDQRLKSFLISHEETWYSNL